MSIFQTYLQLGFQHILNWQAFDHLLFILAITCIFTWSDIKHVLWLVTAFTLGHSITLALATIGWITTNPTWIEFLIPCTIFLSAIQNLNFKDQRKTNASKIPYFTVLFFGLIHGLGFSNYLQSLLGQESSIFTPLLAFNIGLECGQLIVVSLILILTSVLNSFTRIKRIHYVYVISGIIIGLVVPMMAERIP
jgi:ABC-type antimicrobial peptide transport system permease subunit